ncbi:MAG: M48 family metallopeptidase [Campylobacteraceae bacterium]
MNFFEQQERAKKNTTKLVLLFIVALFCVTIAVVYVLNVLFLFLNYNVISFSPIFVFQNSSLDTILITLLAVLLVVLCGSVVKIFQLNAGGRVVAEELGGRLVNKEGADINETILLNVVEEIAIASGVPTPPVYMLEDEGINAFAAGNTYENAVIGITRGAVAKLNRAELQGVIAHEFSHIFNGDMKLNIKTIGILNGILFISIIGAQIVKSSSRVRTSNNKNSGGIIIILAVGLALYILGLVGVFFGNVIKAAINRQREYLADSSAVQFTRHAEGIAGALKKIGAYGSVLKANSSSEFSHLYFSDGVKHFFSLSTHPPLEKRIKALDPSWDGDYEAYLKKATTDAKKKKDEAKKEKIVKTITTVAVLDALNNIGTVSPKQIDEARDDIARISLNIKEMTANPLEAQFLIFAMLLDKNESIKNTQIATILKNYENSLHVNTLNSNFNVVTKEFSLLKREDYLRVITLSMPALKLLSLNQYKIFRETLNSLINADNHISWFEWNLKYLVIYVLDLHFEITKLPKEVHSHINSVKFEVELFLSALSCGTYKDNEIAQSIFDSTKTKHNLPSLKYIPFENLTTSLLENAIYEFSRCTVVVRKQILEMSISCIKIDDIVSTKELETIHALSGLLRLPLGEI